LKVNDLSDVVTTDYGLHLILVTDRKPGESSEFEKCKDDVRDCLLEEMRQNLLAELRAKARIEIKLP
jgi:peptidyl-prolyl cis-trans isomerase C